MSPTRVVRDYFDREAERFDTIYEDLKPWRHRVIDRVFRGVMRRRLELVRTLGPLPGHWTVLDVGCGSGRFSVELALRGAAAVVGIDVAEHMIALARADARARGVGGRCQFHAADYLEIDHSERFNLVLAIGYFDYVEDPYAHLNAMLQQCKTRVLASFPKRFDLRVPTRILRIRAAGGFVRFYTGSEIARLLDRAGVRSDRATRIDLGRDYFLIIDRTDNELQDSRADTGH
jgi:2-polyprenyl-3-methyl-5-hydroxy-6-metoxy-1,4-benzoquinol methylase